MKLSRRSLMTRAGGAVLGGSVLANRSMADGVAPRAAPSDSVAQLLRESEAGNAALMRGDVDGWVSRVPLSADFVLRSPFGGAPTRGLAPEGADAMRRFFRDGTLRQDVVTTIETPELIVLAVVEQADVAVGGLPKQPWALRVTLVYRREPGGWRLVLRHADPLAGGVSLVEAAAIGRRPVPPG